LNAKSIDFIVYEVSDVGKSVAFYRDILGLDFQYFNDEADWSEFLVGETTIALCGPGAAKWGAPRKTTPPTVDFKGEAAIALAVDDIKTAVAELREKEVSFAVDIKDSGVCYFAVLTDPDGNRVWLHQGYADYHNE
jgi:catechol 2,3-dioxygenase-like lactoylglutathione lyase family enzyme